MSNELDIPILNNFNMTAMPLGRLKLTEEYVKKITRILKSDHKHRFALLYICLCKGKDFEIIGCSIVSELKGD